MHLNLRQKYLLAYVAVVAAAGLLVMACCRQDAFGIAVMGITAIVTGGIVWSLAARRLRRSINRLRRAADVIGSGDFTHTLPCEQGDELAKLVQSFNRMADRLGQMAAEERRLRSQLTRSERLAAIGELAATVAHEVNNPLDGIQNCTRILRRDLQLHNVEQARRMLDLIDSGLYRIEMIVRRLLSFARDEAMNLVPTPLGDAVGDALLFIQPRLDRHRVELVRHGFEQPVFALGDRTRLAQVVINLLLNAVESTAPGGRVAIRLLPPDEADPRVRLVVEDNGAGIDPENLPRIFEPFFSTKGADGGTGLGLAVVKKIVDAHHGSIEVDSRPGVGTRFVVSLPAAQSWPRTHEAFAAGAVPSAPEPAAASHGR